MSELEVKIPSVESKSYKIKIGSDILGSLWKQIRAEFGNHNYFVITDENIVSAGHMEKFSGKRDIPKFAISPAGEISKNINTVISIIDKMEKTTLGRDTIVIALGGGTVGDIAGFVAAIFKRGVQLIQVPTTTVAQADSAVGGKTGVDSTVSKNAFGAFWQPAVVYIDVATLKTLDDRQYRAGLTESVKHALIADEKFYDFLEKNMDSVLKRDLNVLEKVAYMNCKIKAQVVQEDPTEKNQRRMLNYGHTIGHALESVSGFELLHGEAIAIGIIAAGLIEIEMGLSNSDRLDKIKNILGKLGMPGTIPNHLRKNMLIDTIKHDKKAVNKWPKFVLIDKIGRVYCRKGQWAVNVEQGLVEKVLDNLY